jgi:small GTP-binding protein
MGMGKIFAKRDAMATKKMKAKICLIGESAVGKTCLIRRYVLNMFDDKYISTLGTKVTKKNIIIDHSTKNEKVDLTFIIWDIMGQKGFRALLKEAYFDGANGIIAVCDVTRKNTLNDLDEWIYSVYEVAGKIPIVLLANKSDLKSNAGFWDAEVRDFAEKYDAVWLLTSAKTGENVEDAFNKIGEQVIAKAV